MPSYHGATVAGLRKLRVSLAQKSPGDPALKRLDEYLDGLPRDDDNLDGLTGEDSPRA